MTGIAILFLVISIVVVWGGLVASVLYLRAHPTDDGADDDVGVLGQAGERGRPPESGS
jgi:Putative methionine and alanine importer, small subunit